MTPARTLAEQLSAVLAYRSRPDAPPEPIQSTWSAEPVAAIESEVRASMFTEHRLEITPSIAQIEREMDGPVERNGEGQIVKIGRLQFSDGKQTEKAFKRGPDGDVVQYDRRMPEGAMLGCIERLTVSAGSNNAPEKVSLSNARLAAEFGVEPRPYITGKRDRRRGKSYTADESRALIAEAIANTPVMPTITKCPPGLANGNAQVSDCFIGMKIAATGQSGAIHWVDLYTAGLEREEWLAAESEMEPEHKATMEAAMTATNLAALGVSGHRRTRERQAYKRLVAANDNLVAVMRKHSA